MGAFIVNYQVRAESQQAVGAVLKKVIATQAAVSPPENGWITVYDEQSDSQDDAIIQRIAAGLSRALKTDVLAFLVHDSDIAKYWLFQSGNLLDQFDSNPDYFGEVLDDEERNRLRGNAELLLPLCIAGTTAEQIDIVLHPEEDVVFAEAILTELALLLDIDESRISLGYEYFSNEGTDALDDASKFLLIESEAG